MNNNLHYIIRHLDNELSFEEKQKFAEKLKNDIQFQTLFNEVKKEFDDLKFEANVNEFYFNSLLPKARKKMEKETITKFLPKIAFSFTILFLMVLVFHFISNSNNVYNYNKINTNFSALTYEELITENLVSEVFETENNFNVTNQIMSILLCSENIIDEDVLSFLEYNLSEDDINSKFISQLSNEEMEKIYTNLINKEILR